VKILSQNVSRPRECLEHFLSVDLACVHVLLMSFCHDKKLELRGCIAAAYCRHLGLGLCLVSVCLCGHNQSVLFLLRLVFSTRCNIYISRLCYDVSVRLSVTEVHWRIIANLGFKFRSKFTVHCG